MKKLILLLFSVLFICNSVFAEVIVYGENNKFGLKDGDNIITEAKYKKLIRLGKSSWIVQSGSKYGIIQDTGVMIIEPKYNQAERILGKYAKFRKGDKYGIFDEMGFTILPAEYSSIDLLYGGLFVTCKNYKYGIADMNGQVILDNIFDDIYTPDRDTLILVYGAQIIEITKEQGQTLTVPYDIQSIHEELDFTITDAASSPLATTGYYGVTVTDYILKFISSISPAYEQTIDELMFSQGADTVGVLMKFSWIPKFPFVYAKKYYKSVVAPNNGPLNKIKVNLKSKIKD